mmetsp:Transcript_42390/g.133765  ORF Transcript_42390/g.133765 Transcript_42390/m.133765 type:complete len:208 (+) Transcript_42390:229-852(+)
MSSARDAQHAPTARIDGDPRPATAVSPRAAGKTSAPATGSCDATTCRRARGAARGQSLGSSAGEPSGAACQPSTSEAHRHCCRRAGCPRSLPSHLCRHSVCRTYATRCARAKAAADAESYRRQEGRPASRPSQSRTGSSKRGQTRRRKRACRKVGRTRRVARREEQGSRGQVRSTAHDESPLEVASHRDDPGRPHAAVARAARTRRV